MTTKAIVIGIALAACSGKQGTPGAGSGTGAVNTTPPPGGCDGIRPKVEQLYRAEAQAKEPSRVEDAVADNTRMVMLECATAPDKVSACLAGVATVMELETTCLAPLDDEGSETDSFRN